MRTSLNVTGLGYGPVWLRCCASHSVSPSSLYVLTMKAPGTIAAGLFDACGCIVTVFPLSWITLYSNQAVGEFLAVQMVGACLAAAAMPVSGLVADRIGRRSLLGLLALLIALFSLAAPWPVVVVAAVALAVGLAALASYSRARGKSRSRDRLFLTALRIGVLLVLLLCLLPSLRMNLGHPAFGFVDQAEPAVQQQPAP